MFFHRGHKRLARVVVGCGEVDARGQGSVFGTLGLARDVATGVITAVLVSVLGPSAEEIGAHLKKKTKAKLRKKTVTRKKRK